MLTFTPMSADEADNMRNNQFEILDGEHEFTVQNAVEGISPTMQGKDGKITGGYQTLKLTLRVGSTLVTDWVEFEGKRAFKAYDFCESIGVLEDYKMGTLSIMSVHNKTGKAIFKPKPYEGKDGENKMGNRVKEYVKNTIQNSLSGLVNQTNNTFEDDDIPF